MFACLLSSRHIALPLLIVAGIILQFSDARAEGKIPWATPNWPPFYITEGDKEGEGLSDVFVNYFQKNLKEYSHVRVKMNFARYIQSTENGENICMADLLKKADREKTMHYSVPIILGLPQALVVKRSIIDKYYAGSSQISLEALFNNKSLKGALEKDRSYSGLDKLINQYSTKGSFKILSNNALQLFNMVLLDRIQYMLEYPYAIADMKNKSENNTDDIVTIGLKEQIPYIVSYATCTKNAWGRKVIDSINSLIKNNKDTSDYREVFFKVNEYLDDNSKKRFERLYYEVYLQLI